MKIMNCKTCNNEKTEGVTLKQAQYIYSQFFLHNNVVKLYNYILFVCVCVCVNTRINIHILTFIEQENIF